MLLQVNVQQKAYQSGGVIRPVLESRRPGDLAFELHEGEIRCLFGASGCGKSTLLRIVAGVDTNYSGDVTLDGRPVLHPTHEIGMVMQGDAAFPWLTVAENITFAMRYESAHDLPWAQRLFGKISDGVSSRKAAELAKLVDLPLEALNKYPDQISGGMKQRMLFARALLPGPKVLLLDEPFSSLDYESRQKLQDVLLNVRDRAGLAYICVSHDPDETLFIADEVLLFGGSPARIVRRSQPGFRGKRDTQFTVEFQRARAALHEWLTIEWP